MKGEIIQILNNLNYIKNLKKKKDRNENVRYNIIIMLVYITGIILLLQLFNLQIVHGEEYRQTSNTRLTRESTLKATRGDILDSEGNKLVTSKIGFSLELYKTKMDNQTFNQTILKLVQLLEKNKDKCIDNLPLKVEPYEFTNSSEEAQKKFKKDNNIDENATAEETFTKLKEKYSIQEENPELARKIMVVRYEITRNGFSNIKPVTISKDISTNSVNQIKEQSSHFPGAGIITEPIIVYPYGSLASHILGYVSSISEEEYKTRKDTYDINDLIGKTGIQYTLEEYLKGQDGIKQLDMAVDGTITGEYITKEATAGNNVSLTIDANLQKQVEEALENNIKEIRKGEYGEKYGAEAGAAIVMNIQTGEILALASYPDYEPELYITGITEKTLKEYEKGSNLLNRAIYGRYAPGSIFKMVVATAALETKTITKTTEINDIGLYPRGYHPACWYYTRYKYGHGYLNVKEAIQKSCNYFFYELGYRMGIAPITKYAKMYGLGSRTGIELSGESEGIVDLENYCMEVTGQKWQLGDTLSAVIGQSYNSYTPIQIARYISMIANGGKAVDVTLIKSITDINGNQIPRQEIEEKVNEKLGNNTNEKLEDLNVSEETLDIIRAGMKGVTSENGGTAYYIFSDLGMDIAGKTGSAETNVQGKVNGWFAGFAPYENPEIAIVVLIENAGAGGNVAPVAKDIIKSYFGTNAKDVKENVTAIPSTGGTR